MVKFRRSASKPDRFVLTLTWAFLWCLGLAMLTTASLHAEDKTFFGGNGDWNTPESWDPVGVPTAEDRVIISSGTVSAAEPVTITGEMLWNGGTLSGDFTIAPTAVVSLQTSAVHTFAGALANKGQLTINGAARLQGGHGSTFSNTSDGIIEITDSGSISGSSTDFTIVNDGVIRTSVSATTVSLYPIENTGTIDAIGGAMNCQSVSGGGTLRALGDAVLTIGGANLGDGIEGRRAS